MNSTQIKANLCQFSDYAQAYGYAMAELEKLEKREQPAKAVNALGNPRSSRLTRLEVRMWAAENKAAEFERRLNTIRAQPAPFVSRGVCAPDCIHCDTCGEASK